MNEEKRIIALGFFDGVHRGHGALLRRVTEVAAATGAIPAAVTFDTHPENLIMGSPMPLISSPRDRSDLMRRYYGIQEVIVAHFDQRMMHMPWQDFITDFLISENGAVHLVAGHDFHFGYKGEGNPQRLQETCARLGVGCDIIPKVALDGITISSTYIRGLLAQGELEEANYFLGHPHSLTDTVAHGKKLGGSLGFPTVNLHFAPGVLVPARGVYATLVFLEDGSSYLAVTNIGVRPTVDSDGAVTVEGFLLDFD
ncbi:MAG: riboflavin kinase, partial [Pseudoflavonifractor sp.]